MAIQPTTTGKTPGVPLSKDAPRPEFLPNSTRGGIGPSFAAALVETWPIPPEFPVKSAADREFGRISGHPVGQAPANATAGVIWRERPRGFGGIGKEHAGMPGRPVPTLVLGQFE